MTLIIMKVTKPQAVIWPLTKKLLLKTAATLRQKRYKTASGNQAFNVNGLTAATSKGQSNKTASGNLGL